MSSAPADARRSLERCQILVVEDNWHVATSIRRWLESEGARVIGPASTPTVGQLLAEVHKPQVAIVDLNLGGTYAYPLIEWLDSRGVPVIVVTGYSFAGEVTPNLGAFLSKPVDRDALIEAVRTVTETASHRRGSGRSAQFGLR